MTYENANAYETIELFGLTEKDAELPIPEDHVLTDSITRGVGYWYGGRSSIRGSSPIERHSVRRWQGWRPPPGRSYSRGDGPRQDPWIPPPP